MGYGLVRFLVEFVRAPDAQLGFDLGPFTRGQLLSLPMLLVGGVFFLRAVGRGREPVSEAPQGRRVKSRPKKK
jgi:phosphatidylglycerol:prolipoprotein diacylglycerol transferase